MKSIITTTLVLFLLNPLLHNQIFAQTPPSCVITYPHTNAYYQEGSDMMIRVYAKGIGGTTPGSDVVKVEFFIDDQLVHETSENVSGSYSFVWKNLEVGSYRITARATNKNSISFTSAGALVNVGTRDMAKPGLSAGKGKYIGNIISHLSPESDYLSYWNGVTAENASKWGSVEPYQGMMNWTNSDMVYNYAKDNNLSYRYHAIAWGSQYPSWIEPLSNDVAAFRAAIENYMAQIALRYPYIDQVDVLNENLYLNTYNGQEHAAGSPYFRKGLGGEGETGYDWVIWLFQKAREYFPNSRLVMNDFELEANYAGMDEMLAVVKVLRDRGLIDGFGTQAHHFNLDWMANDPSKIGSSLDRMAQSGLPIYVTELDMKGNDNNENSQLNSYKNIFPVYWNHPAVAGITLWGYIEGRTWSKGTGLLNSNRTKRSAMLWLEDYVSSLPNLGYPHGGGVGTGIEDVLGNEGFDGQKWTVSPNPFSSQIKVKNIFDANQNAKYQVLNINGQLLAEGLLDEQALISLDYLVAGVYFLRLENNKELSTIKLIKKKFSYL